MPLLFSTFLACIVARVRGVAVKPDVSQQAATAAATDGSEAFWTDPGGGKIFAALFSVEFQGQAPARYLKNTVQSYCHVATSSPGIRSVG